MTVVIGIPTRGRREPLFRLLRSIVQSCSGHAEKPTILIVQNDVEFTLDGDAELLNIVKPHLLVLRHESQSGLSYVRNRLLDEADQLGAAWFFGLDDDEWVSEAWFSEMISQAKDPRKIIFGPCHLVYDETLNSYRKRFRHTPRPTGATPPFCATNNFCIHRAYFSVGTAGFRFDEAFNQTGGEDEEFFARIENNAEVKMVWAPDAVVYEERIAERATLAYALMRSRRIGMTRSLIKIKHAKPGLGAVLPVLSRLGLSLGKMVNGSVGATIHFASIPLTGNAGRQRCGSALSMLFSGFGSIEGLLGLSRSHYGQGSPDNAQVRAKPLD